MVGAAREKAAMLGISNVRFSVCDALCMPYKKSSFDTVIIANTLHILPEPEKALREIKRVLKPDGILIAPTLLHAAGIKTALLSRLMSLTGFRAYHKWTRQGYHNFIESNGFSVVDTRLVPAIFLLAYIAAKQK
jgi:phosphatidylethanolamine/phosphatidyl-N-methylethanolamine N-methyltransferase